MVVGRYENDLLLSVGARRTLRGRRFRGVGVVPVPHCLPAGTVPRVVTARVERSAWSRSALCAPTEGRAALPLSSAQGV